MVVKAQAEGLVSEAPSSAFVGLLAEMAITVGLIGLKTPFSPTKIPT